MAKTHVDKRRLNCRLGNRKPTEKQRALIKAVIETMGNGKKIMEAAKEAGYASKSGTYQASKSPTVQKWVARAFKKLGLDDLTIITPIKEALKAVKYDKQGNEIPDWDARLKAADMQIKLLGQYPADRHEIKSDGELRLIVKIVKFSDEPIRLTDTQGTLDSSKVTGREPLALPLDRKEPGQDLTLIGPKIPS